MIGSVVGNYKIIEKIGEGGMGAVFKGVDLMLEREVAIKMLRPELAQQPSVVERFRTEAVTLAKLNHTNIATLHSFFRQGEDFFMVMEYVRGETLGDMIKAQGALQADKAVELFCMALEGIDHAHSMGIVHRDIKPANVMLTETGSIKVMDFGIARVLGTDRMTKAGHLIGTVEYMSPEQVRGEETDARSDIYSLGVLFYEMLTGRVPFNSTSEYELMRSQIEDPPTPPRVLAPHIPISVERAILRALEKKPEARYQTASEFRTILIQKTTGSVTKVDTSPESYVTRETESIVAAPSSGQLIKETRVASAPDVPVVLGVQPKETRAAATEGLPTGYQQTSPQNLPPHRHAGGSAASLLARLNWKHYAAAALVLVILISLPIALIGSGGNKSSTTPPPAADQPSPDPSAEAQVPNTNSPTAQPAGASAPVQPGDRGTATGRNADNQNSQSNTAAQTRSAAAGHSTKNSARKAKPGKVGEAAQAVGGAIKKIGGMFKKKKP